MSNKFTDNLKAKGNEVKGEAKEQYGKATGDVETQASGTFDKLKGAAQEKMAEAKEVISEKIDDISHKFDDKKKEDN